MHLLKIKKMDSLNLCIKKYFEPVENKPGYYWFNKRSFEIISEETLKKVIEEYNKERLKI